MRKLATVSLAMLLVIALFLAGCGGQKSSSSPSGQNGSSSGSNAAKILEESNQKMAGVKSVRATGAYKGNMLGSSAPGGSEAFDFAFDMSIDVSDKKAPRGTMTMKGMGQDTMVYLENGFAYVNVPAQGWGKTPVAESGLTSASPAEIQKFSKGAENLRVVSESGDTYKIAFDVGPKFMQEQLKQARGTTEEMTPEVQSMINDMVKDMKMSAVFTIDKSDLFLTDATIQMSMNVPTLGNMNIDMALAFSDYNKPITVSLPPEAASAPLVENPEGATPGIPSFPGLGL